MRRAAYEAKCESCGALIASDWPIDEAIEMLAATHSHGTVTVKRPPEGSADRL